MPIQAVSYPQTALLLNSADALASEIDEVKMIRDARSNAVVVPLIIFSIFFPALSALSSIRRIGGHCSQIFDRNLQIEVLRKRQKEVEEELKEQPKLLEKIKRVYDRQIQLYNHMKDRQKVMLAGAVLLGGGCAHHLHTNPIADLVGFAMPTASIAAGVAGFGFLEGIINSSEGYKDLNNLLKESIAEAKEALGMATA
jgi:hypothetical protein